jgi:hypothetical protein
MAGRRVLRSMMKQFIKAVLCVLVAVALSPVIGFWLVALLGALMILLPVGIGLSTVFPKTWRHVEEVLLSKTSPLSM